MLDFRQIIINRLDSIGWSARELAERSNLSCHPQTIYRYLRGDRDVSSGTLAEIFDRVGLRVAITVKPKKRKDKT